MHVDHPSTNAGSDPRVIRHQGNTSVGHHGPQSRPIPSSGDGHGLSRSVLRAHFLDFDVHLEGDVWWERGTGVRDFHSNLFVCSCAWDIYCATKVDVYIHVPVLCAMKTDYFA